MEKEARNGPLFATTGSRKAIYLIVMIIINLSLSIMRLSLSLEQWTFLTLIERE